MAGLGRAGLEPWRPRQDSSSLLAPASLSVCVQLIFSVCLRASPSSPHPQRQTLAPSGLSLSALNSHTPIRSTGPERWGHGGQTWLLQVTSGVLKEGSKEFTVPWKHTPNTGQQHMPFRGMIPEGRLHGQECQNVGKHGPCP